MGKRFALIGAAGYVAPRHMKAIKEIDGELVAAVDPFDSVGILDSYFPNCDFFTEIERFDRHLEKLKRNNMGVDYVSICSPNYLHDAHCRLAMRVGADAICEKPVVINSWNINQLQEIEKETNKKVHCILQLRYHPKMIELKERLKYSNVVHTVNIITTTPRGNWYDVSWKGDISKSGGMTTNIGVHLFDLILWLFDSDFDDLRISYYNKDDTIKGSLHVKHAKVNFMLSTDKKYLPPGINAPYRKITIDDEELRFDDVFTDLHTIVYQNILNKNSYGLEDSKLAIELTSKIREIIGS